LCLQLMGRLPLFTGLPRRGARGTFGEDGNTGSGEWVYPDGGRYRFTMTRVG
jgi:hypothetical protein